MRALFITLLALLAMIPTRLCADDLIAGKPPFRRLFLDAMVTEESHGLTRVFHSAEKHAGNPIITGDRSWEGWGPYLYGTVMQDGGKLKMWYSCIGGDNGYTCYAESKDGITWAKPNLGIIDSKGSTANNIVGTMGLPSVMKIGDKRWAMYSWGGGDRGPQVMFSEDGLRWTGAKTKLFSSSDVVNFFYDPYRERYVSTYKIANRRHRATGLAVSSDGLEWTKPVEGPVFGADDLDPDASQVYGMPVFPYQGMYIGLPWIYHARWMKYGAYDSPNKMYEAQKGSPCTVDVQFAWSWNLIQWTRPPDRKPFIALGERLEWDWGMIYTARAPIVVGDKLYFYYGGCDNIHDVEPVHCAIGLATLRLDGFCSMHAGTKEGWLISRREVFRMPRVTINALTGPTGYVVAELLDRNNSVIPGFSRMDCIPFKGDSVRGVIEWKTQSFPKKLIDADKKVRFFLKSADLYSYLPSDIDQSKDDGRIWMDK